LRALSKAAAPVLVGVTLAFFPTPAGLEPRAWHCFAAFAVVIVG